MHRSMIPAALLALVLSAASIAPVAGAQGHAAHEHAGHETSQLELNQGKRWPTDAPLRQGMERVRAAVDKARQARAQGRFEKAQAQALSRSVADSIAYMVQNCRLPPKADATLHVLLGRLSAAATAAETDPAAADGLPRLSETLELYPRYFEHPGWAAGAAHVH